MMMMIVIMVKKVNMNENEIKMCPCQNQWQYFFLLLSRNNENNRKRKKNPHTHTHTHIQTVKMNLHNVSFDSVTIWFFFLNTRTQWMFHNFFFYIFWTKILAKRNLFKWMNECIEWYSNDKNWKWRERERKKM